MDAPDTYQWGGAVMTRYEQYLANEVERHASEPEMVTCPDCEGEGYAGPVIEMPLPYGMVFEMTPRCERCNGTGSVEVDWEAIAEADADMQRERMWEVAS